MNPKSIDEGLEATTQTLEVVSHMQQTSEERIERLERLAEGNEKRWDRLARAFEAAAGKLQRERRRGRERRPAMIEYDNHNYDEIIQRLEAKNKGG